MSKVKKIDSKVNVYHHKQRRYTAIETINLAAKHDVFYGSRYTPRYLTELILENGINNDQQLVSELYGTYQARNNLWGDDAAYYMYKAIEKAIERKRRRYK